MTDGARIVSLHVYPVKGCRALDRARSVVTRTGLVWDRNWMFVNDAGRFLSQRECAGLALIDVHVTESELVLSAAGHPSLRCPLAASGATRRVVIWRDTCLARETGVDTREWLARVTGTRGQLVQGIHGEARISDPVFTGTDRGEAFFPDAYALLVISTASLAALNARLPSPLPMNRFRPNIVIDDVDSFDEDRMTWLRARSIALKCVKPCTRCIVTTTDQRTGERSSGEPLRTLRRFRWIPSLKGVAFGMNAIVTAGTGEELAVGDRLQIEWHDHANDGARWKMGSAGAREAEEAGLPA
jgi:MOSC domain-containing protein